MAAPTAPTTISDADLSTILSRLSSKQSVQSLLILERETGAIIRATGAITRPTSPDHPLAAEYAAAVFRHVKATEELVAALEAIDGGVLGGVAPEKKPDGELAEGPSDDVRLCTIRTRRRELLLVPDAKFIMVVFHDTPAAP